MIRLSRLSRLLALKATCLLIVCVGQGTLSSGQTRPKAGGSEEQPIFNDYRGVQIGWLAEDVRKKLGSPADKGEEQDFYIFNDKETAQILYDKATHKVVTISVDFAYGASGIITPQQVFGADVEAKPDGSKHKLVRYPKAGYWISYSRTAGDTPIITVTIQKLVP